MIGHDVDDHPEPESVSLRHEQTKGGDVAEERIHSEEVADVVSVVESRRRVEGRDPHNVDPEPGKVGELAPYPFEIAYSVSITVAEGANVDLVADGTPPPRRNFACGIDQGGTSDDCGRP